MCWACARLNVGVCLSREALDCMCAEVGGVNSDCFFKGAQHFVKHMNDLTANGRKGLLTYDGYRSHMNVRVLDLK